MALHASQHKPFNALHMNVALLQHSTPGNTDSGGSCPSEKLCVCNHEIIFSSVLMSTSSLTVSVAVIAAASDEFRGSSFSPWLRCVDAHACGGCCKGDISGLEAPARNVENCIVTFGDVRTSSVVWFVPSVEGWVVSLVMLSTA
jgi:hypothetical protein